jgi:hypothetical protein
MYQVSKIVPGIRRAMAVAVLPGSLAWLGVLIGAEAVESPAARHIVSASSVAPRL